MSYATASYAAPTRIRHVSRIIPLGNGWEKRYEMFFFSGGKGIRVAPKRSSTILQVYASQVRERSLASSLQLTAQPVVLSTLHIELNRFETQKLKRHGNHPPLLRLRETSMTSQPDILIADVDINALRLAQRYKIPSV